MAAGEYGARVTGLTISERAGRARARARRCCRPRRPGRDSAPGLPDARGALHQHRLDRDARGDRPRAVPRLLRRVRPAARAGRARVHPDDRDPGRALRELPPPRRLDPPLHLPRLAAAVCRGAEAGGGEGFVALASTRSRTSASTTPTTLQAWRERFLARLDDVRRLGYDERFVRTWDFYLAYCEAAFRTRSLRDVQLVLDVREDLDHRGVDGDRCCDRPRARPARAHALPHRPLRRQARGAARRGEARRRHRPRGDAPDRRRDRAARRRAAERRHVRPGRPSGARRRRLPAAPRRERDGHRPLRRGGAAGDAGSGSRADRRRRERHRLTRRSRARPRTAPRRRS